MADAVYQYDIRKLVGLRRVVERIERAGKSIEPPLNRWGAYKLGEVGRAFRQGGLPEDKWPPLKRSTIEGRNLRKTSKQARWRKGSARTNPRRMLQDSGGLMKSPHMKVLIRGKAKAVTVYSKHPLALIHNEGATIKARTIRRTVAKALRWWAGPGSGDIAFAKVVQIPQTRIPARPFIKMYARDIRKALNLLEEHAAKVVMGVNRRGVS